MIQTFSTLIRMSQAHLVDNNAQELDGVISTRDLIIQEINNTARDIYSLLKNYKTRKTVIIDSEDGKEFYPLPKDLETINTITQEIAGVKYPLEEITSQEKWDTLTSIDFSGTTFPQYYFARTNDFGIYPKPNADDQDIALTYQYMLRDMSQEDYVVGTVSVTNGSDVVEGDGTSFTDDMVGRFFVVAGYDYRIVAVDVAEQELTLDEDYQGATGTGLSYIVAESPDIPPAFHSFIPYRVSGVINGTRRNDPQTGQDQLNFYYTGDFKNPNRDPKIVRGGIISLVQKYNTRGRSTSQTVRRNKTFKNLFDDRWTSTLS